ncbi:MAG TPA: immunoglobulin-like domain-containing protein [Puia sp.]
MKYIFRIAFNCLLVLTYSCHKETIVDTPNQVGISKVAYYPSITINGAKFVAVTEGEVYNDPGATAMLNGDSISYTTSMSIVATTTQGVYTINYTATSSDGSNSDQRIVVVVPASVVVDPVIISHDYSGNYLRAATGVTSTWTKLATGVYTVENPGGSSGVGLLVVATNYSSNNIEIPEQDSPYFGGVVSSTETTYDPPGVYTWIYYAPGYGTGPRTFAKQ